jgi:hypothetical protein
MGAADQLDTNAFVDVWASTWLRPAPYRRRPASFAARAVSRLLRACVGRARRADPDYFSQLANIPDLPQRHKVLALSIVMHQRKEAALRRLIMADEA